MKNEINKAIIRRFIKAINDHDANEISALMSDDHIFVDGMENKTTGKIEMKAGWESYLELFPDYKIEISEILEDDNEFGLFGYASGTYKKAGNFWRTPAAWKGIVEKGLIKHWQVYCDYSNLLAIISKSQKGQ